MLSVASRREVVRGQWRNPLGGVERDYGLGMASGSLCSWDWFGHSGGLQVYVSRTCVLSDQELTLSVLTNAIDGWAEAWVDDAIHILVLSAFAQNGAWLHRNVGPDYMETLIAPSLGSYTRLIISRNTTDELYSGRRAAIQEEIKRAVAADVALRTERTEAPGRSAMLLDDVLILGIQFPSAVQAAIDRKMEQYQLREEYGYRIQREELESKRKEIEARGIAQFQNIVGAGISDNYLRWKSIDATLALAQSQNTKIVVVGSGRDNMPLFLNGEDGRPPQPGRSDPNAPQVRAQTPLSGPVPATDDTKSVPRTRWLTSRIGELLKVRPPAPPEAGADEAGVAAGSAPR